MKKRPLLAPTLLTASIGFAILIAQTGLAGTVNVDFGTPTSNLENNHKGVITSNGKLWNRVTSAGAIDLVDSEGFPSAVDIRMDQVSGDTAAGLAGNDLQTDGVFGNGVSSVLRFTILGLRNRNGNHKMAFITATTDRLRIEAKGKNGITRSVTVTGGTPGSYPLSKPEDYKVLEIEPEKSKVEVTVTNLDGNSAVLGGLQIYGGLRSEGPADLSISKQRSGGYRGNDVHVYYVIDKQRIMVSVRNRPLNVYVKLKNQGETGTEFYLEGKRRTRELRIQYFDAKTGKNLSGKFLVPGHVDPGQGINVDPKKTVHLDARETRKFRVRIRPKNRFRKNATARVEIFSGPIFQVVLAFSDSVGAEVKRK